MLSRVAQEFKSQFNLQSDKTGEHHDLGPSAVKKEHDVIDKVKAAILKHGNPFVTEGDKLHNVITHAYIPMSMHQRSWMQMLLDKSCTKSTFQRESMEMSASGHQ